MAEQDEKFIQVNGLNFGYEPGDDHRILFDIGFSVEKGARCLLLGHNGSGKTTLLRIMSGRHVVKPEDAVLIGGQRPFYDLPQGVIYVSSEVSPHHRKDCSVEVLLNVSGGDQFPERRDRLIEVMQIETKWRMHRLSDGQRRRVLIAMGLIQPRRLLLLDEATIDMDIMVRKRFFNYLKEESERDGLTIIYCSHIFDGLGDWATHILHLANGRVGHSNKLTPEALPDLMEVAKSYKATIEGVCGEAADFSKWATGDSVLYLLVEKWLRQDAEQQKIAREKEEAEQADSRVEKMAEASDRYYNYWDRR
eukprot:CAMPEP_0201538510 /NCGR_PEP_ID=MMETSP0161_2-20130828/67828_1 /ASSEMBLY_ACC=CAM_ASM_000251 /TAXON_ID=180227 /ORGANISM="Neoparamoeba aestuarina, Strain SoJaBio B1-5/56/2" /LENGTH=306 /DNA_ID=CAMNT_0047945391 /DNA_START=49 /DNA_END=969 /DNA_ORIENTATION=+